MCKKRTICRLAIVCSLAVVLIIADASWPIHTPPVLRASADCTHFVSSTGNDANPGTADQPWETVYHAALVAEPGYVVCVAAGDYTPPDDEDLIFTTAGTADQPITFTTYNGVVTLRGAMFFEPGAAYINLNGFIVTGFDVWGISLAGVDHIVLSNLDVSGGEAGIVFSVSRNGDEYPVDYITVQDSVIHDAVYTVVDCTPGPCNNMQFQRLEIYGAGDAAANFGSDGLAIERGTNILVEDCYVHNNSGDGIDLNSRDQMQERDAGEIIVRRNRLANNALNGIKLWRGGQVINNVVWNNGDTSLVVERGNDYLIVNNTFATANQHTYLITLAYDVWPGETTMAVYNNIFYNDDPRMTGAILFVAHADITLQADYNVYFNPHAEEVLICMDEGHELCFAADEVADGTFFARTGYGEHSVYADPLFVDPVNGDLRLAADSPALDHGDATHAPLDDVLQALRPAGAGVDIGAYEQ